MFHNLMGYITNIALAAFLGFLINVGLDMQSIYDVVNDPYSTDWQRLGTSVVDAGTQMQRQITPFVEGPVADFAQGIKQGIQSNQHEMIYSNPTFSSLWADRF